MLGPSKSVHFYNDDDDYGGGGEITVIDSTAVQLTCNRPTSAGLTV